MGEGPLFLWEKVHFFCGRRSTFRVEEETVRFLVGERPFLLENVHFLQVSVLPARQARGADLHGMCDQVKVLSAQYVTRQADLHGV